MRKEGKDYKVESFPVPCDECLGGEDWKFYGCGFHNFDGKSDHEYTHGATESPFNRTCPQYCLSLPIVQKILSDLKDYKRGNLGNVLLFDSDYLDYLRCAEMEADIWQQNQEKRMIDG